MADKKLQVFYTSVSSSLMIKKQQEQIFGVLTSHKIPFEAVDISQDSQLKELMRTIAGNQSALPPQICYGDVYCGNHAAFENAIETETLNSFLKR
ncbi:SH3 domain-binding glutamic acid-rich-like protein 3 [Aulostomus maculatus]